MADVRRIAYALMYAIVNECAMVSTWPHYRHTADGAATITTSGELRRRCAESGRPGLLCYLQPVSVCNDAAASPADKAFSLDKYFHLDTYLDRVRQLTGLRSEVLVMGTLVSWIMRPQPELREATIFYGTRMGLHVPGARHRRIAMHVRKGDKHSLYAKHMRNESWRVSARSFEMWGRRIAADVGAERVLYMTDDMNVMMDLAASKAGEGFFSLVPGPRECLPSYSAGVLGKHHVPAAKTLAQLHGTRASQKTAELAGNASAACGQAYFVDDGIQLFAGLALLAQCGSFVGTQISNVDAAAVELMATLRHPPTVFDVLNDMHRACLSDEQVWFGGVHQHRRPSGEDRLARGDGSFEHGNC
jgi:hypothetical protein